MHKNVLFLWSLIVLLLIIPMAWGDESGTYENDNANMILLKAGPIHTDIVSTANDQEIDENPDASIASYSVDMTETDDNPGSYYIVQFNGPVLEEWKGELAGTGAVLFDYIPNNAFVVRMDPAQKEQVDSLDFVKWTGEYRASYKHQINTGKVATLSMSPSSYDAADLIVLIFDENESRNILERIISMDADIVESSPRILRVRIARDMINDLAAIEGICWIEEYAVPVVFNDVAAGIINLNPVHENYRLNGTGQIVAVCDTGLDTGNKNTVHEDVRGRILEIIDYSKDGALDYAGHGTHVSGSLIGNGYLSSGDYKGTAPGAKLVFQAAQKDTDSTASMSAIPENLSRMFQDAYDVEARIHSNSWGDITKIGEYTAYAQQVDQFMWEHPDMLILFAAGNKGVDINKDGVIDKKSIISPATAKNCITVGASENERFDIVAKWGTNFGNPINTDYRVNNSEGIAATSSRGPTKDNRTKPDLVAPGTFIASARSSLATYSSYEIIDNNYVYMTGTSMATPLVAGAAALTRQYYTDIEKLTSPSAALIKATLINGAHDMTPGQYGTGNTQEITGRPDNSQGWGRVDVENSLFPEYPKVTAYHDRSEGLVTSQAWSADYGYIKEGEKLRATLVWTDYPGSPASGKALVNDLDLTVTGSGNTYYGNGAPESINNIEAVDLESTSSGSYQFTVTGMNVPQGPQPFALALSFTCDNSVFPAHDSSTSESMTLVTTNVVHPGGVNLSSINMEINGVPVSYTNSAINGGYKIQHDTSVPYQSGEYNVSVTALTAKGKPFSYGWKFNVAVVPSSAKSITSFRFNGLDPDVVGVINEASKTITLTVPYGTDVTALVPTIVHTGASISPNTGVARNFTNPVTYTVTAADGTTQSYTVTVTVAPSPAKSITSFRFNGLDPDVIGTINEASRTITLTVPYGTDVTALVPTIVHTGASISPDSGIARSFSSPVTYTVTAADRTTQSYTVTVTVAPSPAKSITSFRFNSFDPDVVGVINEASRTITLTVPYGTDVTALVPTIVHTGASVSPNTGVARNFTNPVTYTVTAADGTTQSYTVTVTVAPDGHYSIEIGPVIGGNANVNADKVSAAENENVSINISNIEDGKMFSSISVAGNSGTVQINTISSGASYSFLMPAENVTVEVTLTEQSATTPTTSSGGGGGGGGGSTGEKTENILLKDVSSVFVGKDAVRFDFKNPDSDIQYIEYTSLKNSGTITATIEMLKDRSIFAISSPEGTVYRHVNIWVGKTGYATEANIIDPAIVFRVDNSWISSNNIDPASINLNRYSDGAWSKLPTEQTGSDADFLYFKAVTPGFSPFAITGESFENESTLHSTSEALFSTDSAENKVGALDGSSDPKANGAQAERTLPALSVTVTLIIVLFACFLPRKQ
ncbi:MAG: PGF-pre-PGF domain-containing protein [Methanolobus sp.]|uniref:PGF-pre-PGF domain-containing protein n=1 Tax=Methanolobus sp. TaxID=1874737 RepID=UPI00273154F4|nr:PGF-pre-PGF domain-containing protein [Methanolobus sp.]MDP2217702.1 PGF-pre-PGF domain-containing protein [Methanolobus sp.]